MSSQTSARMLCPSCSGGNGREESFSLQRLQAGVFGKCWRATCGFKTFVGFDKATGYIGTAPPKEKRHKAFVDDISDLPRDTEKALVDKYEVPAETLFEWQVGWCYDKSRLVMPILGAGRRLCGYSLRDLSGLAKPKVLSYRTPELPESMPLVGMYAGNAPNFCVVVEDQISAMKIYSLGFNAIALMGCDLSLAKSMFIQKYFQKVVIFLDFDALNKVRLDLKKVGWLFEYTSILFDEAKRDPKDIPREELRTKLREESDRIKDTCSLSTGQEGV